MFASLRHERAADIGHAVAVPLASFPMHRLLIGEVARLPGAAASLLSPLLPHAA